MKKLVQILVASILLGFLTIQMSLPAWAEPFLSWFWDDPVMYENQQPIPGGDLTARTLKCGTDAGGPYPMERIFVMQAPPSREDMAFVVNGVPGDYYCVSTVWSIAHLSESGPSNEHPFTVAPGVPGYVPMPPTNLQVVVNP